MCYSRSVRSHPGRAACAWTLLVPTLALGASGMSQPASTLGLRWSDVQAIAPHDAATFEAQLSLRLGHPAFEAGATEQVLAVTWGGDAEHCRVELSLLRASQVEGTRLLQSPSGDCKALQPALLTVAALLIEGRAPSAAAPEPPEPPPPPPPAATEAAPEAPAAPRSVSPAKSEAEVRLGVALGAGLAPELELGPGLQLALTPGRIWRFGIGGALFPPHEQSATPGLALGHQRAGLFGCLMPMSWPYAVGLCAQASLHRFSSAGLSLPHPQSHKNYTTTLGIDVRFDWHLTRQISLGGSIGPELVTRPLSFYFTPADGGERELFRQRRVALAALAAVTVGLP
jgi:hypothetical protein